MRSDRQIVAAAFRGRLDKPVRSMTPAYVARLAKEVRAARSEGRRPERQAARGHTRRTLRSGETMTTEHPKARVRRGGTLVPWSPETKPTGLRVSSQDRHVAGHGVIVQRDFQTRYAAWRWATSLSGDVGVQVIAHGELVPDYGTESLEGAPGFGDDVEAEATPKFWRTYYTGNAAGEADENGATFETYEDAKAAEARVFVVGSCDAWIVRWQR